MRSPRWQHTAWFARAMPFGGSLKQTAAINRSGPGRGFNASQAANEVAKVSTRCHRLPQSDGELFQKRRIFMRREYEHHHLQRDTRWFDATDAAALVDEGGLAGIIERFAGTSTRLGAFQKRRKGQQLVTRLLVCLEG